MSISANQKAPLFELSDQSGEMRKLSDFRGKHVVLYFYPKDDTPGCTVEACSFRDGYADYKKRGVIVLGVSPDSTKSHAKFASKYELPFILLSDPEHKVCEAYGVWGRKKFMGKEYDGVFRTTFLIGPEGDILRVFENVKPEGHAEGVLSAIQA